MNFSEHFAKQSFRYQEKDKNWIYSPYSISMAMGMSYLGAVNKTQMEIEAVFQFLEDKLPSVLPEAAQETILIGNGIFISDVFSLRNDFATMVKAQLQANAQLIRMKDTKSASAVINRWIANRTQEGIQELVKPEDIDPDFTRLILVNVLYFMGQWKTPFEKERTKEEVFYKNGAKEQKIKMMTRTLPLAVHQSEASLLVALPYRDDVTFFIILPREKDGWKTMTPENWEQHFDFLQSAETRKTKISLPQFSLTSTADFSELLKKMGIVTAFSDIDADFSKIAAERLKIDKVLHQSNISIDENGTEASAATTVLISHPRSAGFVSEPLLEVKIDHPFFFVLRHNQTKDWLFIGQYLGE